MSLTGHSKETYIVLGVNIIITMIIFKEVKNIFSFILHSKRLKGLLIYSGIFTAQLLLFINVRVVALTELHIKEEYLAAHPRAK